MSFSPVPSSTYKSTIGSIFLSASLLLTQLVKVFFWIAYNVMARMDGRTRLQAGVLMARSRCTSPRGDDWATHFPSAFFQRRSLDRRLQVIIVSQMNMASLFRL